MGLFKTKDERRIEREIKVRTGMRSIERSIRDQEKFSEDFIRNARSAQRIGDNQQYLFIRGALKKTAVVKRMLERQLLAMKNAMLIQQQARACQQFAESMNLISREIARSFGETDLTQTRANWEKALAQAGTMEERMDIFLDAMEQGQGGANPTGEAAVTDEEIDRMIATDTLAEEKAEMAKIDELQAQIEQELSSSRQKD